MLRTLLRPLLPHRPKQNLLLKLQSRNKMKVMPSLSNRPLLPLLQAANLAASNTKKLATLVREHVLAPFALHTEPRAPSRNSFHAGVSSQAQKCAVVGLQLDAPAAVGHSLQ